MSQTTLLPDYLSIVQNTTLDFYNKSTNLLNAYSDFLAELNENIKFTKSQVTVDMLSSYALLFNELNATNFTVPNFSLSQGNVVPNGDKTMNDSFKLFFVEKYLSLSKQYRDRIDALIQNNSYFTNFSDDIGYITDLNAIVDNNVNPYFDIYNQQLIYQTNLPATVDKKITTNNLVILKTFSYYANALLKVNLQGLQEGNLNNNTAQTSHGTNLINDILYFNRALQNQQAFLTTIQGVLGDISSFILFFKELNPQDQDPQRKAVFAKYEITNLENLQLRVDYLKNNLNKVALSSKTVLGATPSQ